MRLGYPSGSAEDKLLGPQFPVQRPCFLIVETRDMHPLALCLVTYFCETETRDLDVAHPVATEQCEEFLLLTEPLFRARLRGTGCDCRPQLIDATGGLGVEARRVAGSSGSGGGLVDIHAHALLGAVD
ncbi:predicted protein [Chaetomium globosum CBS 148.51]|uniref:Uncharacterized protein n=1 Tax=Chaetomium globosum (strain ATCC 6205 / CBS 148.51 / DSM 1962 / NBRC 6347 / NRRL 1970) TaxID=306901 RepID=Q2GLY3_CHAGB|nr:uncharacterized protein CHGG_11073 [Chaetomium globosum CBS 148.51]EAQ82897.1 predicted protein [Chaetomium globosum CBS 148.51]